MFNYIPIATRLSDDCGIQQIEKNATYSYLQEVIGINRSAIQKMIQALQGKGYIDRDESGSWRVFITPSVL
jgi:DNA-binding IclR family transcriptional regulator